MWISGIFNNIVTSQSPNADIFNGILTSPGKDIDNKNKIKILQVKIWLVKTILLLIWIL